LPSSTNLLVLIIIIIAITLKQSNDLIRHLPSAAFVALDEEMTGITLPSVAAAGGNKPAKDETAQQRYQAHLKPVAERYSMVQLGICLFHQHPEYDPIHNPNGPEFMVVSNSNEYVVVYTLHPIRCSLFV
jgi:poly(A)-specific ribonuclease